MLPKFCTLHGLKLAQFIHTNQHCRIQNTVYIVTGLKYSMDVKGCILFVCYFVLFVYIH